MNVSNLGRVHDRPDALELVTAVREWLAAVAAGDVEPNRFHARIAANMLAMVERQSEHDDELAAAHAAGLASLGVASDGELAAQIRSGGLDERAPEVRAVVLAHVRAKLSVANPDYLSRVDSAELLSETVADDA